MANIKHNLFLIKDKIKKACKIYNQNLSRVNLIAVSKTMPNEKIVEAIKEGQTNFGENYIKEAKEKWSAIKNEHKDTKLHFIGHLQSNKAKEAVELFDVIHTLDSEKLAKALKKEMEKQEKDLEILIQVNIGLEEQKSGILPKDLPEFLNKVKDLNITGLMCIPPSGELASPYFALLTKLAKENNLKKLSMGMSGDFEEAIALGADYIRVGTAIFGDRPN